MMRKFLVPSLIFMFAASFAFSADPAANWTYVINPGSVDYLDVARSGLPPEIYFSGGNPRYWMALRHNESSGDYDQVYFSGFYSSDIVAVKVAEVTGDSLEDILVMTDDGRLRIYDQVDKSLTATITVPSSYYTRDMAVTDVDGDGAREIIICQSGHLYVYSTSGILEWDLDGVGGSKMVIAQMDGDPALEIATTDGFVIDSETHSIQWDWYYGFGSQLAATDIDGDGRDEIAVVYKASQYSGSGCGIMVLDAASRRLRTMSALIPGDTGTCYVTDLKLRDVNRDGRLEILTAAQYSGINIVRFNADNSLQLIWSSSSSSYFYSVDADDIDNDSETEIIGGASDGYVYVYDFSQNPGPLEWRSLYLRGTVRALSTADVDQDGMIELIAMVSSGDVYVFNGETRLLEGMIMGPFTAMQVKNMDGIPSIVLANSSEELMIYRYASGQYLQTYKRELPTSSIAAFTLDWRDHVWVSTGSSTEGLYEMTLDGSILETYSGYGSNFGQRVAVSRCARQFYTAGSYVFAAFPMDESTVCSPDLDGDGISDAAVWRPDTGDWYILRSGTPGSYLATHWGQATDKTVTADYDGDGRLDLAVWRPGNGTWYILPSLTPGSFTAYQWGTSAHYPVPGDYDGDGKADVAVWDPDSGLWYILSSELPGVCSATQWGMSTDIPVPADYDGDGETDIAVWRPGNGVWYILPSGSPGSYITIQWGLSTDIPVPADYDGDEDTDIAVWRPGNGVWYILPSGSPGSYTETQWGQNGDVTVPGDYDGDGKMDMAVWRPGNGIWYILPSSSSGSYTAVQWGYDTDVPISRQTGILGSLP